MNTYIISITIIGVASLAMAWMPSLTEKTKISYAIIYVLAGALIFSIIPGLPDPDPIRHNDLVLHLSELAVIVSVMGTGLKIDEPFSLKLWKAPFRLVTITMLLCIAIVAFCAWYFFHFDPAAAILLGAVFAPTDPVLASDVQVGPPQEGDKDNIKFVLTAEAGMNDGMAFPFTWLAIAVAISAGSFQENMFSWFGLDLFYRLIVGVLVGYGMGKLLAYLVIILPERKNFVVIKDGFVGIAATLLVYGITELIKGYGFVAVFITAITLRNSEMGHKYHKKLHGFTDQIERILVAILLLIFGGALASGILTSLTPGWAVFCFIFLFLIRPLTSLVSLIGIPIHIKEKIAIGFFGIRGMGSFFYLAFAFSITQFNNQEQLWSIVSFIVAASILIHGISATTIIKKLSGRFPHIEETQNRLEEEKESSNAQEREG